ncbi:MAG: hypothetical protein ACM3QW_01075 [Ignavibacteriales bacterium]
MKLVREIIGFIVFFLAVVDAAEGKNNKKEVPLGAKSFLGPDEPRGLTNQLV